MRLGEGREFAQVTQLVSWHQDSGPKAMNLVAGPGGPWEAWRPPPYSQWGKDETSVQVGIQEPPGSRASHPVTQGLPSWSLCHLQ